MTRVLTDGGTDRSQMVLLAAAAIAVALVPLLLAYMQLGYHPDVARPHADHAKDVTRTLERSLVNASGGVPADYPWSDRGEAVTAVRNTLSPTLETLNRSALARNTAIQVSLNATRARARANTTCPGGPGKAFGSCRADRGVVVQDRAGQTHVLAAAVDVHVIRPDGQTTVYAVVERW